MVQDLSKNKGPTDPTYVLRIMKFLLLHPKFWLSKLDHHFREDVVPEIIHRLEAIGDLRDMDLKGLMRVYEELMAIAVLHIRTSKWGLVLYSIPLTEAMEQFLEENGIGKEKLSLLMTGLDENKTLDASNELQSLAEAIRENPQAMRIVQISYPDYTSYRRRLMNVPKGDLITDHFGSILVRYGHRRLSRDLMSPSWSDDPMIPFGMVRTLVCDNTSRTGPDKHQTMERRLTVQQDIERRLPLFKRLTFRKMARYLARYTSFREFQRFYLDMILSKMRGLMIEISKRMLDDGTIENADDIFFIDIQEVLGYLQEKPIPGSRKKALLNRLSFENRVTTPGRYLRSGVDFDSIEIQEDIRMTGQAIKGQGVSPGLHSGRARVIPEINGEIEISRGDVMVTRGLDPGQTHFLMMAGALILEVGGMLSHGAILARELGVPTVAQIRNATYLVKNGQQVLVNGSSGVIIIEG
jgi:pyruvate,water dikinase